MSDFWNNKFKGEKYLYGTEPNPFFRQFLDEQVPGKLLLPAEGEGRNAAYAAIKGWDVTAFDNSSVARDKAFNLLKERNLSLTYNLHSFNKAAIEYPDSAFDVIALCYFHLPSDSRTHCHQSIIQKVKTGGYLYIIGFSKEQLKYTSGGPSDADMLFDQSALEKDFKDYNVITLRSFEDILSEGEGHKGIASLTEAIIKK